MWHNYTVHDAHKHTADKKRGGYMKTTQIYTRSDMKREPLPNCHGGKGALDWTEVLNTTVTGESSCRFIHDNIMPPGASVGVHEHTDDEEFYYIIRGYGVMTLDGTSRNVGPGDLTVVRPGGSHGLENTGNEDLRFIVVCVTRE